MPERLRWSGDHYLSIPNMIMKVSRKMISGGYEPKNDIWRISCGVCRAILSIPNIFLKIWPHISEDLTKSNNFLKIWPDFLNICLKIWQDLNPIIFWKFNTALDWKIFYKKTKNDQFSQIFHFFGRLSPEKAWWTKRTKNQRKS